VHGISKIELEFRILCLNIPSENSSIENQKLIPTTTGRT
jgi:hypothetical protein